MEAYMRAPNGDGSMNVMDACAMRRLKRACMSVIAPQLKGLHLQLGNEHKQLQARYSALYEERVRSAESHNDHQEHNA